MKKTKLKLKRNVKSIMARLVSTSISITVLMIMLLSKTTTIQQFKVYVLIILATFIIDDLIPDLDTKKDL